MNITYIKVRRGRESVKDPLLYALREVLPNDKVSCAEVPENMPRWGRSKIELNLNSSRPDIIIGCGDAVNAVLSCAHRFCIIINPSIFDSEIEEVSNLPNVRVLMCTSNVKAYDVEFLRANLCPLIDSVRDKATSITNRIDELTEMAFVPTEKSPEDFDPECDILDNLNRHRESVELSEKRCPDCGHEMISFFVSSPAWTWKHLCGRAGRLNYCPMCKTQHGFWLQIMN